MSNDKPYQKDGQWWYRRLNPITGETRPHGPFFSETQALHDLDDPNFEGHEPRECGEHRSVGSHRAWCHYDGEWCYPDMPCRGCELPQLRKRVEELEERNIMLEERNAT